MEKMKKFKEWLKKHRKKIFVSILLIIYLFLFTVKLFAMPHSYSGNVYQPPLAYDIIVNDVDIIGGNNLFNDSGKYYDIVTDNNDYSIERAVLPTTEIVNLLNVNTENMINKIKIVFSDGFIRFGDLLMLPEFRFDAQYYGTIYFTYFLPNSNNSDVLPDYVQYASHSLWFDETILTPNDSVGKPVFDFLFGSFRPNGDDYTLTSDTMIYIKDFTVEFQYFESYGRVSSIGDMINGTFVEDDNAYEEFLYNLQNNIPISGICASMYNPVPFSTDDSSDNLNVEGVYFGRNNYSPYYVETDYIEYSWQNNSLYNMIIRSLPYETRITAYLTPSWRNSFNGKVYFSNADLEQHAIDLFNYSTAEWGYIYGSINGINEFDIYSTPKTESTNEMIKDGLSLFGGYYETNITIWQGIEQFFESTVGGFLDTNLFGIEGFTFGNIVVFIIGLALVMWVLKVFLGG